MDEIGRNWPVFRRNWTKFDVFEHIDKENLRVLFVYRISYCVYRGNSKLKRQKSKGKNQKVEGNKKLGHELSKKKISNSHRWHREKRKIDFWEDKY